MQLMFEDNKEATIRDTGGFMSVKLDRIKGLSADDILYNTGQLDAVPIDLNSIIHFGC